MTFSEKIAHYVRFTSGVHAYLRTPVQGDWLTRMREQLEHRGENWLAAIRRGIFDDPNHPYARMCRIAGCEFGDLEGAVRRDGLEAALEELRRAGVYLTHDEFKQKEPIVRGGQHIPAGADSFANPLVSGGIDSTSSGSRSRGTMTRKNTAFRMYKNAHHTLEIREFRLTERVHAVLKPILPASSGLTAVLRLPRVGCPVERWFAPGGQFSDSAHYRLLTNYLITQARLRGVRAPFPTHLPQNDFRIPAQWLAERRRQGVACIVKAFVSPAVRVVSTALEEGLDIAGSMFFVGGEALTDAKRRIIESAGCEVFARYTIDEVGPIGYSCRQMKTGNRVHLFHDVVAVVTHRRPAPLTGAEVNSLMFTTLLPVAPNLLINAEMDDAGIVEKIDCDCEFARAGFIQQVRDIHSYGKLTGQGVTLVGTHILAVLEKLLPERFGGAPTDYQLVENEERGQTQVVLRVSPRVRAPSDAVIQDAFLRAIENCHGGALAARVWRHAGAFQVMRAEPIATATGKILPLHLLQKPDRGLHAT